MFPSPSSAELDRVCSHAGTPSPAQQTAPWWCNGHGDGDSHLLPKAQGCWAPCKPMVVGSCLAKTQVTVKRVFSLCGVDCHEDDHVLCLGGEVG